MILQLVNTGSSKFVVKLKKNKTMKLFEILITIFFWVITFRMIPQALDGKMTAVIIVLLLLPFTILLTIHTLKSKGV
jgi:hypothetical protein